MGDGGLVRISTSLVVFLFLSWQLPVFGPWIWVLMMIPFEMLALSLFLLGKWKREELQR